MRVLQVAWEYPPRLFGGLGRHVEGLTAALAGAGVGVTVLTPGLDGPEGAAPSGTRVLRAGSGTEVLPPEHWIAEVLDANVAMAGLGLRSGVVADVIHVHDWMAGHAARILAPALDLPVVATVHATERGRHMGHLPPGVSAWIDEQERALVALADRTVVCATDMRQPAIDWLGASDVEVIPNGVDASRWAVGATRREDRVVFAGRLEYEKGVQVLTRATHGLPVEVVVAGKGTHGPQLRREAHDRVRFAGHLDQPALAKLLSEATLAVVPSLYEPFGLAALEAMAAGTPVIASDVGGLREIVRDGAGVRVPPGDAAALRREIARLLADPSARDRLAAAGRIRARELSWSRTATRYLALYESLRRW